LLFRSTRAVIAGARPGSIALSRYRPVRDGFFKKKPAGLFSARLFGRIAVRKELIMSGQLP
jgi:hypothetical protein